MAPTLDLLPAELLSQIVACCETAQTLLQLSLTSKNLHHFVHNDGFRVFVHNRFPSIRTPAYWKDAAHALTTLSRNWDRKAFLARIIAPPKVEIPPHPRSRRPLRRGHQQTMGYQPVIDSYEDWSGGNWSSRKEVLVWGAGAELILRCKKTGDLAEQEWHEEHGSQRHSLFNQHHHKHDWYVYRMSGASDGRDDITSANLLSTCEDCLEHVFVGRASGSLHHISHSISESRSVIEGPQPILAACLAENAVALYPTNVKTNDIAPLDEVRAVSPGAPGRTWSSQFLCNDRLAVGRGPSGQPILVYGIRETGFSGAPLRRFDLQADSAEETDHPPNDVHTTSVYPIIPIAPSSAAGGAEGDIFLSGGYDGNVRLHDMRSPASSTARFVDIVDNSAIYSLLAFGRERFVAGASRFAMLKVFDLRMPGGKMYHYANADTPLSQSPTNENARTVDSGRNNSRNRDAPSGNDYNMYLEVPDTRPSYTTPSHGRRRLDCPVYSLSAPSPCSPAFYAGVENGVVQLDVVSTFDRHPDPLFSSGGAATVDQKWDPNGDAMRLRLYTHSKGNLDMMTQNPVAPLFYPVSRENDMRYWDGRWRSGK